MNSNKAGQYYKTKTKKYFEGLGYTVVYAETMRVIRRGHFTHYVKQDMLGADVLAVNDKEAILANSVLGRTNVSKHIREFEKYPSGGMKRMVVIWEKGCREPEIRLVDNEKKKEDK